MSTNSDLYSNFSVQKRTMANITEDGNFTSKLNQTFSSQPTGTIESLSAFNIFLSITASLGNALVLIALHKISSIYPPTKLFFRCLAVTDLFVGLIVQPLFVTLLLSHITGVNENVVPYVSFYIVLSWCLCGVSGLTTTAISVDRLLALLLGLKYRHVVTLRRVRVIIICFWFIAAFLWSITMFTEGIALKVATAILTLCVVISIYCNTRIFFKLRHQQAHLQNHVHQQQANGGRNSLNIARYKKLVSSVLCVQLALVACYTPWGIDALLYINTIHFGNYLFPLVTETLVYLNSSLNPILYCWKIREVRQAVKDIIRQLNCLKLLK